MHPDDDKPDVANPDNRTKNFLFWEEKKYMSARNRIQSTFCGIMQAEIGPDSPQNVASNIGCYFWPNRAGQKRP